MKQDGGLSKHDTRVQCTAVLEDTPSVTIRDVGHRIRTLKQTVLDHLFKRSQSDNDTTFRLIPISAYSRPALIDERTNQAYISNSIRSSRYTIYDFLPKQLLFQCTRLNNFYFIVIGIPQAIPGFSTTGNFTTILPLLFFICLTILKEGYDDLRRHRLDKSENKSKATILRRARQESAFYEWTRFLPISLQHLVSRNETRCAWSFLPTQLLRLLDRHDKLGEKDLGNDEWEVIEWQKLRVGDIVSVEQNAPFPADIVLLSTDKESSLAFVETMALDGETNLKPKQAPCSLRHCKQRDSIDGCTATLAVEQPNKDLYSFSGHIKAGDEVIPLSLQQVVLRGSILRNTKHAIGIVINTGEDCKIRMNANHHPQAKKPHLERWANYIVLVLIAYVVLLSIGSSIGYIVWQSTTESISWYLNNASVPFKQIIIGYGIMYNNIIPLALYVSLEIVKLVQMMLISSDINMYDEKTNQRMRCNTNTILENLGQVDYLLTDKTGTLTENCMEFKAVSVAGCKYDNQSMQKLTSQSSEPSSMHAGKSTASDAHACQPLPDKVLELLLAMTLCHTCLPTESGPNGITYQASSPDEVALVKAAADLGYRLTARSSTTMTITSMTGDLHFEVLDVIDFTSNRKRMSILLLCPDQQILLLSKGADDVMIPRLQHAEAVTSERKLFKKSLEIQKDKERRSLQAVRAASVNRPSVALERLRKSPDFSLSARHSFDAHHDESPRSPLGRAGSHKQPEEMQACFQHLEDFASQGLRTLVFARRFMTSEAYIAWRKLSTEAHSSVVDRQAQLERAAEALEQSMELLGITAIEDKLQHNVPETIEKLRRANMRIWMLTGDKRETAISIAHSSHICRPESVLVSIDESRGDLLSQLHNGMRRVDTVGIHSVAIVDGHTLSIIESSTSFLEAFYQLALRVDSVICCRASPSQKAGLVQGIRKHAPQKLVLTIGDGANDVAMIQAAHVGVGMMGKEGMQAARVADYCIAQFSFLQRLLLVHGRWNYLRTAKFILNTFWKEMLFYLPQTLYQVHTGYSGSSLYENWSLTALNTLFTSLCVILPGVFEQDLRAETLLAVPELYVFGQKNRALNMSAFILYMASATIEGMIVWHVPYKIYGLASRSSDSGAFALGHMVFSLAIIWTNWKLLLIDTHTKTKIIFGGFLITVAGWWIWSIFLSAVYSSNISPFDVRGGFVHGFGQDPVWWCTLIVTLTILILTDLLILAVRRYLVMNGRWPLWPANAERRYQARELEAWQETELEHAPEDRCTSEAL